jgi:hypothetical protein
MRTLVSRSRRGALALAAAVAGGILAGPGTAAAQSDLPSTCSEPLWPMCATDSYSFNDPVARQRCAQDLRRYIQDVTFYRDCLDAQLQAAKSHRAEARELETCLADRERQDCSDVMPSEDGPSP